MTAQELLDTLNRLIHDELISPNSIVIVRTAGTLGGGIEMTIEKLATRVVAAEPQPGQRVVKIMGL
ncbi:MAG: hypothetical protein WCI11_10415 [Candidatus Methylumidiphilus sp.]